MTEYGQPLILKGTHDFTPSDPAIKPPLRIGFEIGKATRTHINILRSSFFFSSIPPPQPSPINSQLPSLLERKPHQMVHPIFGPKEMQPPLEYFPQSCPSSNVAIIVTDYQRSKDLLSRSNPNQTIIGI